MAKHTAVHHISEESLLDFLRAQSERPVAVIVLGGNDQTTEQVTDKLALSKVISPFEICRTHDLEGIDWISKESFARESLILVDLVRGSCVHPDLRRDVIQKLRDRGAKSVITLWVKGNSLRDNINAQAANGALREHPPTTDGADHLFILEP